MKQVERVSYTLGLADFTVTRNVTLRTLLPLAALIVGLACSFEGTPQAQTPDTSLIKATCAPTSRSSCDLMVFAASSLTEAFTEIKDAFEKVHLGYAVTYNFAGTPTLRTQIEQGARADVFASANEQQMEAAIRFGVIEGEPVLFASNRLVVVTPKGSDVVASLQDLARPGVKLVLALRDVPVGGYAREAIAEMGASGRFGEGFEGRALGNLVSEEVNVRQALSKVALGEADASIVYATDVTPEIRSRVDAIDIPDSYNVIALYPMAAVKGAAHKTAAELFIDFVLSAEGQSILSKHGFGGALS